MLQTLNHATSVSNSNIKSWNSSNFNVKSCHFVGTVPNVKSCQSCHMLNHATSSEQFQISNVNSYHIVGTVPNTNVKSWYILGTVPNSNAE